MAPTNPPLPYQDAISLRDYFEARLEGITILFETRIDGMEQRIEQARIGMEKRLDGMNEFRDALKDQSSKSPTRTEMIAELEAIKKDLRLLNTFKDTQAGKASQSDVNQARLMGIIGIVVALIGLLLKFVEI
jgi:hypothetical protein